MGVKANIAGGQNELGKKIQHRKGRVTKKNYTGGKTKIAYIVGGYKPIYP
jgi:hypothetical protein